MPFGYHCQRDGIAVVNSFEQADEN